MVAKKKKRTRQMKRKAAREAAKQPEPGKPPMVKLELTVNETKIVVGALMELPMKIALPISNKVQLALQGALTVQAKRKK